MGLIPYLLKTKWAFHNIQEALLNIPGVHEQVCVSALIPLLAEGWALPVTNAGLTFGMSSFSLEISANNCPVSASTDGLKAIVTLEITCEINSEVPLRRPQVYYVPHNPHSAPTA
jgi:hypothetical protein